MATFLTGKVVVVVGSGSDAHRAVAVALATAGADIAVAGSPADIAAEAALHSIANEVWAMRRRSTVVKVAEGADGFAAALNDVKKELGRADLVLRCDPVIDA